MKIEENSIKNIAFKDTDPLFSLSLEISRGSVVFLGASVFSYTLEKDELLFFNLDCLQKIHDNSVNIFSKNNESNLQLDDWYIENKIKGIIEEISYARSCDLIKDAFNHYETYLSQEEVQIYMGRFFDEIGKYIQLPPTHVFVHNPDGGTVFSFGAFWNFCLIYLDNNLNKGVVLHGNCSD
jgi:hypothetical protein